MRDSFFDDLSVLELSGLDRHVVRLGLSTEHHACHAVFSCERRRRPPRRIAVTHLPASPRIKYISFNAKGTRMAFAHFDLIEGMQLYHVECVPGADEVCVARRVTSTALLHCM
jgi:hypothetical protein